MIIDISNDIILLLLNIIKQMIFKNISNYYFKYYFNF